MTEKLDLTLHAEPLRARAVEELESGDVIGFLSKAEQGNTRWLEIVARNATALRERGRYEEALLHAWNSTRTNNALWSLRIIRFLFSLADPAKLRALGDPLPDPGPFTLYRGVAGVGAHRRERSLSWSSSPDCTCWFALRFGLPEPTVLRVQVDAQNVLVYLDSDTMGRGEQEFLVMLPSSTRPAVHTRAKAELEAGRARWNARKVKD